MTRLVSYRRSEDARHAPWRAGFAVNDRIADAELTGGPATVRGLLSLGRDALASLVAAAERADGLPREVVVLGPPVPDPDKILCIGLNYAEHAEETQLDPSAVPTVFAKFPNSLIGSGAPIVVPAATGQVDYEGELALVVGRRCRRVSEAEGLEAVGGVMPFNDVSARDLQFQSPQWTAGKAVDTFAPCGPELVIGEVPDVADLRLRTFVNGDIVQDASTSQLIFGIGRIVSFLSSFMTLEVGDIIATGTPAGVGFTREPPLFLTAGDLVEVHLEGVGRLRNSVEYEDTSGHRQSS